METWKDVKGFEKYYKISKSGRVRRKENTSIHKIKDLKGTPDKDGYIRIKFSVEGEGFLRMLHRLLAIAFIPNPDNKPQINHKNGIKYDNNIDNLEWCTLSENRQHAYNTGLQNGHTRRGSKNNFSKLTKEDVLKIRNLYLGKKRYLSKEDKPKFISQMEIAEIFNVKSGAIQAIITRRTWNWLK